LYSVLTISSITRTKATPTSPSVARIADRPDARREGTTAVAVAVVVLVVDLEAAEE
jgi:hypothetical protein